MPVKFSGLPANAYLDNLHAKPRSREEGQQIDAVEEREEEEAG
jgi:hypothetical protein